MKKKKIGRKTIITLAVVAVIVVLIILRFVKGDSGENYIEMAVETRDITTYLEFSGNIEAVDVSNVYAKAAAMVKEVLVKEGDKVKKGDVIARLDDDDINYSIELKEKTLEMSKLQDSYNIKDTKTNLDNMTAQLENGYNTSVNSSQKLLLNTQEQYKKAVDQYNKAKSDYDNDKTTTIANAKRNLDMAKASKESKVYSIFPNSDRNNDSYYDEQIRNAENDLADARKQAKDMVDTYYDAVNAAEDALHDAERDYEAVLFTLDQSMQQAKDAYSKVVALSNREISEMEIKHLKESLDNYTIYSPLDGYVTLLNLREGEYVSNAMAAAEITNLETMQVAVNIDEYDIAQVNIGDPVEIYINAMDIYYTGKISSISKKARKQADVSYLQAVVEFETDKDISSGLSAEVKLIKSDEKNVTALSVDAIEYDVDNSAYVMVKGQDGKGVKTPVTLGVSDGSYVQILSGLKAEDVILTTPKMLDYYEMMMQNRKSSSGGQ